MHPITEVNKVIERLNHKDSSLRFYSNSPDFIKAVKYYGEKIGYECEFFLDGTSHGNDIEPLFEDFNRAYDLLEKRCSNV